ncbi:MAG TPA: hypothetical protein VG898_00760 [Solirubrobacterales bacterium]|nr:hypothetical protein [Solirubrobacterales bacterium]
MGGKQATSPDGTRWRVRRRWLDRPLPDLRKRFRELRRENVGEDALDGLFVIDFGDSVWASIGLAIAVLLLVVVLLPVLGIALELILIVLLLGSGLVGRVILRRPWTVEAQSLDVERLSASYAVKGWRRSGRAAAEIATAIETSGPPDRIAEGVRLN